MTLVNFDNFLLIHLSHKKSLEINDIFTEYIYFHISFVSTFMHFLSSVVTYNILNICHTDW